MEDINYYLKEAEKAIEAINARLNKKISYLEFQVALGKSLGLDPEDSHMIPFNLTSVQMIELLSNEDFESPELIAEVYFEKSILPSGIPQRLDEQTIKVKGEIWRVHKSDKDPFPSNPHAHNLETGYKLHLGNGALYNAKNKPLGKSIDIKHLNLIRSKIVGIDKTLPLL